MYELTVALPYAKATFDFAVEHQTIEHWLSMLFFSAEVSRNKQMIALLSGTLTSEKLAETFINVCGDQLDKSGRNLIKVMAEHNTLAVLPNVLEQFLYLRAEQESTMKVDLISSSPLKKDQLIKITTAMEQRLLRKVKLNCKIDKSIVAGIIILAGDIVIDNSVRGRLQRLSDALQS